MQNINDDDDDDNIMELNARAKFVSFEHDNPDV
jgi:hypothetical protein